MNNKDKTLLINTILKLEKSIDRDISKAFSEMTIAPKNMFIEIAKKYAIGEKFQEYYTNIMLLQKNYLLIILEKMTKLGDEKDISRENIIEYSGHLFGPRKK